MPTKSSRMPGKASKFEIFKEAGIDFLLRKC
jgi:hypothetical protein